MKNYKVFVIAVVAIAMIMIAGCTSAPLETPVEHPVPVTAPAVILQPTVGQTPTVTATATPTPKPTMSKADRCDAKYAAFWLEVTEQDNRVHFAGNASDNNELDLRRGFNEKYYVIAMECGEPSDYANFLWNHRPLKFSGELPTYPMVNGYQY